MNHLRLVKLNQGLLIGTALLDLGSIVTGILADQFSIAHQYLSEPESNPTIKNA